MYFPLFLDITKSKFLLIGAGHIALAKLETIVEFGGQAVIVAQEILPQTRQLADANGFKIIEADYDEKYLDDADIIIAATNDAKVNHDIAQDAKNLGKLINVVDDPNHSQFIFGAGVKKGEIILSVSTSGVSPVLARLLKSKLQATLPANLAALSEFLEKNKQLVKDKLDNIQARRLFWQEVIEGSIVSEIEIGNHTKAQALLEEKLANHSNHKQAAVYFIGAGPGDPELITLKAIKLLSKADVVLYDRLASNEILSYARKDALKINVGKICSNHRYTQEEINQLIVQYAKAGNIVARLKGGDTSIFARVSEEIDAILDLKIPYQIIPGVTSAAAAAAYSGFPLTSRDYNKSTRFLTIYKQDLIDENYWQELANTNDSLALYMSSNNLSAITQNLIKFGKDPQTPLAIIEQASTPFQKTFVTTLENFDKEFQEHKFVSPSITIVGEVVRYHQYQHWRQENLEANTNYFDDIK